MDGPTKTDEFLEKFQKGGRGGSFPIQKFMLQIFAIINASSVMYSGKKAQHDFPKMRGGQRPFGTFPKIDPFWKCEASLKDTLKRGPERRFQEKS